MCKQTRDSHRQLSLFTRFLLFVLTEKVPADTIIDRGRDKSRLGLRNCRKTSNTLFVLLVFLKFPKNLTFGRRLFGTMVCSKPDF